MRQRKGYQVALTFALSLGACDHLFRRRVRTVRREMYAVLGEDFREQF